MRAHSVSDIKFKRDTLSSLPKSNTLIRKMYDHFYENRGKAVDIRVFGDKARYVQTTVVSALVNFYGCDIRYVGLKQYSLVGEWYGKGYIDYTVGAK